RDRRADLRPYLDGRPASGAEQVRVSRYGPDRVELTANLERPGIVVLADVDYPGWGLTIDGRPAPIYRVNRAMRGAAVPRGEHRLTYTFRPLSFRVGLAVSCAGLAALAILAFAPAAGGHGNFSDFARNKAHANPPRSV